MKSLFLLSLLGISLLAESPSASTHGNQGLDMQLNSEIVFEEMAHLESFKSQVGTDLGIEVRLRDWY